MRHSSRALLVAAATAASVATGLVPAQGEPTPTVTSAHLRIELTTSSDWARIRLEEVRFPVTRTLEAGPMAQTTFSGDAWTIVNSSGGTARFVVDTIAYEPTGRSDLRVVVEQGQIGSTTASVQDPSRSAPVLSETTGGGMPVSVQRTLSRADLLGSTELRLPHGDPRRLVLAAYYPWFQRSGNPTSRMAEEPLQPRSAWILDDVRSHAAQARAVGIDGFAVSWAGDRHNGPQLDLMLQAMTEQGGVVVPYLETAEAEGGLLGRVDKATVARWLDEALQRSGSPAFLRSPDGVPVVMVFAMGELSREDWEGIAADSAQRGRPVRLVGDVDPSTHGSVLGGWHRYSVLGDGAYLRELWTTMGHRLRGPNLLDPQAPTSISLATVSPGYDDTRLRGSQNDVIHRGPNGERYEEVWDAALASDPDWVLITSWNEWFEGTSIEPGTVNGDRALQQTAARIAAFKGTAPAPAPAPSTTLTTTAPPSEGGRSWLPWLPWPRPLTAIR